MRNSRQLCVLGNQKRETFVNFAALDVRNAKQSSVVNFAALDVQNVKQSSILRPCTSETRNSCQLCGLGRPKRVTVVHFAALDVRNSKQSSTLSLSLFIHPPTSRSTAPAACTGIYMMHSLTSFRQSQNSSLLTVRPLHDPHAFAYSK